MPVRRSFGSGPSVSLFTLGTMRAIGSEKQMSEVVKAAFQSGINHLETSSNYGPAEELLGSVLNKLDQRNIVPNGGWVITSKLLPGIGFADGKKEIKHILSRLKQKKISNLAIHGINLPEHLEWFLKKDIQDLISWAKEDGLIEQVGFSSHGKPSLIEQAINTRLFQFCSLHVHLLNPENIPLALKAISNSMGVMAISPADKGGHLHHPSLTLVEDCNPLEPLELAYRFLLAKGISTLTLGASKPEDLNIANKLSNSDGQLSKNEEQAITQLLNKRKVRLGKTSCEQCKNCMPCPNNVPISNLLHLRNLYIGHDLKSFTRERYNLIGRAGHWWEQIDASACNKCEECIPLCPNNLNIPDLLEETDNLLKESPRRRLWD